MPSDPGVLGPVVFRSLEEGPLFSRFTERGFFGKEIGIKIKRIKLMRFFFNQYERITTSNTTTTTTTFSHVVMFSKIQKFR